MEALLPPPPVADEEAAPDAGNDDLLLLPPAKSSYHLYRKRHADTGRSRPLQLPKTPFVCFSVCHTFIPS